MTQCRIKTMVWMGILLLLLWRIPVFAAYDYVDISNPSLRKIPMAIPYFKVEPYHAEISRSASDICSDTLNFTGYFTMVDRSSFPVSPQELDITGASLNFESWMNTSAELLITCGTQISGNALEMEFRLFDTFKGKLLLGKRYKGSLADEEEMVRRFCSEVIFYLTGSRGLFNSSLAFVSTGSGNKEIWLCDFDGRNPRPFTHNRAITLFPAWSSDGQWIAYTSYKKGKPDIYVEHVRDKRGFSISYKGLNSTPAWVPGQFNLAATLSFEGDQKIYLLTGNGQMIRKLTDSSSGIDTSPTWSPDGQRFAFVSARSGSPQIYVMRAGSGQAQRLTFQGDYNTQPSWSPKGDRIAYTSRTGGGYNICTVSPEGGGPSCLTRGSGDNESPSWAPDGSMIVFSSNREGPSRIYVMTSYGTDQRSLLSLPGQQTDPDWSPEGIK